MPSRSQAQKRRHQRARDPLSVCWRCSRKAVELEYPDPPLGEVNLERWNEVRVQLKRGVCTQHSASGKAATKSRGAIASAAPQLLKALHLAVLSMERDDEKGSIAREGALKIAREVLEKLESL